MSCYNPMIAVKTGRINSETGKQQYKFLKAAKRLPIPDEQWREFGEPIQYGYSDSMFGKPEYLADENGEIQNRAVVLPCGQCLACRVAYAQQWANRIMIESGYHQDSYFVTLTYDPEHVPMSQDKDGSPVMTLNPKDLQDFIKRLREQQSRIHANKVRFYAVGEYGSQFFRPHYHVILFGLVLTDLKEVGKNKIGTVLHDSETIRNLWKNGLTEVDRLNWESAAYAARYTTKKLGKSETDFYKDHGLVPEFTRMSLRPAIGAQYFEDHAQDIYRFDEIHLKTSSGGRTVKPPRYFDKKFDDIYPSYMEGVKAQRSDIAKNAIKARLDRYEGSYLDLLYMQEQDFKNKNKMLRRNLK